MRKSFIAVMIAVLLFTVLIPSQLFAKVSGAELKSYDCPFLITSGGQGAGSKMLRLLINQSKQFKLGKDFTLEDETPARWDLIDSGKYKALVVVMSVTEKGLGASGITIEDEINYLKEVVKKAQAQNMPIIAVSMERDARSKISTNGNERVIDTICPNADWIITIAANNKDNRFTDLGNKYNIPVTTIDAPLDLVKVLPSIFVK